MRPEGADRFEGSPAMPAILFLLAILFCGRASAQTTAHKVTLSWTASADASTVTLTYTVYRASQACASGVTLAALPGGSLLTSPGYVDTSVVAGGQYCYQVVAVAANGAVSSPSNQVSVTIPLAPPTALTAVPQ